MFSCHHAYSIAFGIEQSLNIAMYTELQLLNVSKLKEWKIKDLVKFVYSRKANTH